MCFQRTYSGNGSIVSEDSSQIDTADEFPPRFKMSFYRVFCSCCVSFSFCMMVWMGLASFFHIGQDAILLMDDNKTSPFILIPNSAMLFIAVVYNMFGLMSFSLWELRIYNNQLTDNVAHRVVRLTMMVFVMFFSAWNATIYQTGFSFAMGRLFVFFLVVIELAYHSLLSIHLIHLNVFARLRKRNTTLETNMENAEVEMNEKVRF